MALKFEVEIKKEVSTEVQLGAAQQKTLTLLQDLKPGSYTLGALLQMSELRSPLPLWHRLRGLEEKGFIRIVDTNATV